MNRNPVPTTQPAMEPPGISQRYHQALRAAIVAGAQLELGSIPTSTTLASSGATAGIASMQEIDRLEPLLNQWIANRLRDPDDFTESSAFPADYVAAFELFEKSGRIDLVLDSLSLRRTIDEDLSRMLRPVWFYLALLLLVAALGLAVFANFASPRLAAIRTDMRLMPAASVTESWMAGTIPAWLVFAVPCVAVAVACLALSTKASSWVAMKMGGGRYHADRLQAMNATLEKANMESSSAMQTSGRAARLSFVAENRTLLANDRLMRMRVAVPTLMIALIGGGGVLLYGLVVFAPLIVLIHDMASLAADQGVWP